MDNKIFSLLMGQFTFSKSEKTIAVAVSGGVDSMALAVLTNEWAKKDRKELITLTVNHNLRKEAAKEAKNVAKNLAALKIKNETLTYKGEKKKTGLMEFAREIRYGMLLAYCRQNKIKSLLVAHNAEDQAETMLMRLARGSGLDGLSGIAPQSTVNSVRILRPLLTTPRKELEALLKSKKIKWVDDPTNKKLQFRRNKLRFLFEYAGDEKELLVKRLSDTAIHLQRVRDFIETEVEKAIKKTTRFLGGKAHLDITGFKNLHAEIGFRLLVEVLLTIGGKPEKPRFDSIKMLYSQLLDNKFRGYTLAGCKIYPSRKQAEKEQIIFEKESLKA